MLADYMDNEGECFEIKWPGWKFSGQKTCDKVLGLHYQDFVHNGKKLINPLDSLNRLLVLGEELVMLVIL